MPFRTDFQRLRDILDAISRLKVYCESISYEQFLADAMRRDAVERQFIRLGEAATGIAPALTAQFADIPWGEMRSMRNFVTHVYWGVNPQILWDTVRKDLPGLEKQLRTTLSQVEDET